MKETSVGDQRFLRWVLRRLLSMPVRDCLAQISASSQTREQVQQAAGGHGASTQPFNYSRLGDGDVSAGDAASQKESVTLCLFNIFKIIDDAYINFPGLLDVLCLKHAACEARACAHVRHSPTRIKRAFLLSFCFSSDGNMSHQHGRHTQSCKSSFYNILDLQRRDFSPRRRSKLHPLTTAAAALANI